MRRGMSCRTFRGRDASRRVASTARREVRIQADGGRAEPTRIAWYVSAADGIRRDVHADMRREAQRQTRPRRRSKLQELAPGRARTDACREVGLTTMAATGSTLALDGPAHATVVRKLQARRWDARLMRIRPRVAETLGTRRVQGRY